MTMKNVSLGIAEPHLNLSLQESSDTEEDQ